MTQKLCISLQADGKEWPSDEATEGTDNIPAKFLGQEVEDENLEPGDEE